MQEYKSSWVQPTQTMYIKEAVRDTLQSSTGMSSHLQNVTVDNMADLQRLKRGVEIRRPKKKRNLQNDTRIKACIARDGVVLARKKPPCISSVKLLKNISAN